MKRFAVILLVCMASPAFASQNNTVVDSFCTDYQDNHNFTIQTDKDRNGYFVIYNHSSQTFVQNNQGVDLSVGVVLNLDQQSTRPFSGFGTLTAGEIVVIKTGPMASVIDGAAVYPMTCGQKM